MRKERKIKISQKNKGKHILTKSMHKNIALIFKIIRKYRLAA